MNWLPTMMPVAVHGFDRPPQSPSKILPPLALDEEVAADHPETQFVMAPFRQPVFGSGGSGGGENANVAADLSGLLEGRVDLPRYFREQSGYVGLLRTGSPPSAIGMTSYMAPIGPLSTWGVHRLYQGHCAGGALGAGVFPQCQPDLLAESVIFY